MCVLALFELRSVECLVYLDDPCMGIDDQYGATEGQRPHGLEVPCPLSNRRGQLGTSRPWTAKLFILPLDISYWMMHAANQLNNWDSKHVQYHNFYYYLLLHILGSPPTTPTTPKEILVFCKSKKQFSLFIARTKLLQHLFFMNRLQIWLKIYF